MSFPTTAEAWGFYQDLMQQKAAITPRDFEWYPYDSLGSIENIHTLMGESADSLCDVANNGPIMDAGAADGDLAFLLEAFGMSAHCVDNPVTNYNGMLGIRAMKEARGSKIEILEMDLDDRFDMPDARYSMAFCLGLIYHLKNPLYALETLAKHARYAVMSTRVVANSQDLSALAYLLDGGEMNGDHSNHWIFSTAGFRKALKKSKWEIVHYISLPAEEGGDQRDFCFVKSVFGLLNVELLEGWHELEAAGWRWTRRSFSFRCEPRESCALRISLHLPQSILSSLGPVTLHAWLDGADAGTLFMQKADDFFYRIPIADRKASCIVSIELDKSTAPSAADRRELGLIVSSVEFE
jgi:tRNA (mo5U34)-methyltransferase